jgi:hypothetical protein
MPLSLVPCICILHRYLPCTSLFRLDEKARRKLGKKVVHTLIRKIPLHIDPRKQEFAVIEPAFIKRSSEIEINPWVDLLHSLTYRATTDNDCVRIMGRTATSYSRDVGQRTTFTYLGSLYLPLLHFLRSKRYNYYAIACRRETHH